ncbi:MAG: cobalt ECF transporter T component CbiQ [Candidatus Krumholzibacteriia bacterium]
MAGFLEKNASAAARAIERSVVNETWCRARGLLQAVDPRFKIVAFAALILSCSLTHSPILLACLYALATLLAYLSKIAVSDFTKRIWVFVPLFTVVIAIPALFLTPGTRIASLGPLAITSEGSRAALMLVLRVSASVSFSVLLVLTTPWHRVLDALGSLRLPGIVVSLLSLSYRYLLLLLRTLSELFMARRSRVIASLPFRQEAAFISRSTGYLFLRSLHLAEGVHMAMVSRGWEEEGSRKSRGGKRNDSAVNGRRTNGAPEPSPANAFELRDVRYDYPGNILGLSIESLDIPRGRCTILLGCNGSGKSTLLKVLDGLVYPQTGSAAAFGRTLSEKALDDGAFRRFFRSTVGLVFQDADIQCFSTTVREELAFGPRQMGFDEAEVSRRVDDALAALGIDALADRYPYNLSGGEKKRVALASILTLDLDAYLLDEPTANLDPAAEGVLIDILSACAARGKTLVVATQDLMLARHIGDTAIILGREKRPLFIGPVEQALADVPLLERAGLAHAHRHAHREAATGFRHSHYTEEKSS